MLEYMSETFGTVKMTLMQNLYKVIKLTMLTPKNLIGYLTRLF